MLKDSLLIGNRIKILCSLLFLGVLGSCAEKVIEPPENLIPKEKMTEVLYDLALLNSARTTNPKALKDHSVEIMPFLFEKYGIDSIQFVQSDLYYASFPLEYEAMYNTIESRLDKEVKAIDEERKQKNDKSRKKADRVRDSIKKASENTKPPVRLEK